MDNFCKDFSKTLQKILISLAGSEQGLHLFFKLYHLSQRSLLALLNFKKILIAAPGLLQKGVSMLSLLTGIAM